MYIFSMIFAVFFIGGSIASTVLVGWFSGGIIGGVLFFLLLVGCYKVFTYEPNSEVSMAVETHSASQQPLSEDDN